MPSRGENVLIPDDAFIDEIAATWPPVLARKDALEWSHGLFTAETLKRKSPTPYYMFGKVVYKKADVIKWMKEEVQRGGAGAVAEAIQGSAAAEDGAGTGSEGTEGATGSPLAGADPSVPVREQHAVSPFPFGGESSQG